MRWSLCCRRRCIHGLHCLRGTEPCNMQQSIMYRKKFSEGSLDRLAALRPLKHVWCLEILIQRSRVHRGFTEPVLKCKSDTRHAICDKIQQVQ